MATAGKTTVLKTVSYAGVIPTMAETMKEQRRQIDA